MMTEDRRLRRVLGLALAWVVTVPLLVAPGERQAREQPGWLAALENGQRGESSIPWRPSSPPAPLARSIAMEPEKFEFPLPARWEAAPGKADGRPIRVQSAQPLQVEILDRAVAQRLGVSGFVFKVSGAGRADLSIDYSRFAKAYGAGYADRLRVIALPGCVTAGCEAPGTPVASNNDSTAQTLTVAVADVAQASTFAVVSAVGGDQGTFAASDLALASGWQVSPGSGAFSYSYPIAVPAPAGGSAPTVALSYSSAAIDGLTLARNTQASAAGVGWSDFANAFIERQYEPCIHTIGTTDLCWMSENATISLAGISGPLLPVDATFTEWRAQSDPGWRVQRLTGAPYTTVHQGQFWKVTGPDGTQYFFGAGHMPGRQTTSILAVPVVGDRAGEPCWNTAANGPGGCDQGWRWYLDRVVDPDGNVQTYLYEREDNWYYSLLGALGGKPMAKYHRGALLKEIIYGGRNDAWDAGLYSARVTFGLEWRCSGLRDCPAATKGHTGFPDVPTDLICAATGGCTVNAPSFFTGRRYAWVRTEVKIGNTGQPADWKGVAQHNIVHRFSDGLNHVASKLRVEQIQHAAIAFGKLNAYPTTKFAYVAHPNRVDYGTDNAKAMRHDRINKITNPFGGTIAVTYFTNRTCEAAYNAYPQWDRNEKDCFPQSIKDGDHRRAGVFHKYLVRQVVESPGHGSPNMTTTYTYEESPAWAFDSGAFSRDEDELGWSLWRGYRTVLVTKGTAKTRLRMFRGLDGDKAMQIDGGHWVPTGRRSESVPTMDSWDAQSYVDHPALSGRVLEEQQLGTLNGAANSVLQSRRHEYEQRVTFNAPAEYRYDPEWAGMKSTTETVYSAAGAYRQRRSVTTFNANLQPTTTAEEGWADVTGDERCSITTYADNPSAGMYVFPAANKAVAGDCASNEVLSLSETYYDGSTVLGAPPVRGNPTRQRTLIEAGRWAEVTTEYDSLGRPTSSTDANGGFITATYAVTAGAPPTQIPVRATTTNALGQQVITDYHPEFGIPKRQYDINGNVTDFTYDEFGRLIAVWLPTEPLAFAEPSWKFSYDVVGHVVRSQRLTSDVRTGAVTFDDGWVIYDGFWRERQAQGVSPTSGKILVSETTYDDRGLVREEMVEQAFTGTPGKYFNTGSAWLNRTRQSYDELGRKVRNEWLRGDSVAHATATSYGVDTVTVTGPDGRRVRERVDAHGRTASVQESDGMNWVSSDYTYDLGDRLTSATDPAGNRSTYTYNLAGWRISQQDPDRGSASYTYDNTGNMTSVRDALGNQIHTKYDLLGRQTERRAASTTGPLLASFTYDTAPGGKGKPHREITHTGGGDWVSETLGYDGKGRATGQKLVVPAGIAGLSGSYSFTQTLDRADRVRSVSYPAMGGLPAETVTFEHNAIGLPTRMAGLEEYVWGAAYDDRARRASIGVGPRPGGTTWMAKRWTYDVDQKLNGSETLIASNIVSDHEMAFDFSGNLTEKVTRQNGRAWRECFDHDERGRLEAAHTVTVSTACGAGTPGTGDNPYVHGYRYSPDGKLTERTEGGATTAYEYPATGAARPHAPTRIGGTAYGWNANGSLTSRGNETFSWDVQGMLQSVTGTAGTTSFVYDASGQRLLRRTPDGLVTLFVAGHEVTVDAAGAIVNAVRLYTFEGQPIATRSARGTEYVVTDAAGSVEMTVGSGQASPASTRAYEPFGQVRAQTGSAATGRGFLGQVEDASTGLSYLNARYYDAVAGIFISADALYDTSNVKSLNPYTYASNNPTTFSDPSGLMSAYTWGVESENAQLRQINGELIAHIGRLNSHIEQLQDVIRKQQKTINKLVSYVRALEAEVARQASIIRRLQARVAYLERVVAAQRREISRLRYLVVRQWVSMVIKAGVMALQRRIMAAAMRLRSGVATIASAGLKAAVRAVGKISAAAMRGRGGRSLQQSDCDRDWLSMACLGQGAQDVSRWPTGAAGVGWSWLADVTGGDSHRCGHARCVSNSWLIVPWADAGTLGDAIVCNDACDEETIAHEMVHVEQFEQGGIAYPFLYAWESIFGGYKCGNKYERPAYEEGLECSE